MCSSDLVLLALVVVLDLLQHRVDLVAQVTPRFGQAGSVHGVGCAAHHVALRMAEGLETAQEAAGAFHPAVGPLQRLLRRTGEHHEQARRVGPEALDQRGGIHPVVLALGHRADAGIVDLKTFIC